MVSKHKEKELTRLWCKWNRWEISGDDLGHAIGKLYDKETLETWNDPREKLIAKEKKDGKS